MIRKLFKPVASLKLTVVIFALSIFLIFAGTLAQVHEGIWTVVDQYFRSIVVTIDLQIFVPQDIAKVPGAIWFPGGLTLGVAMLVNLIAAHTVRFKFTKKRIGIILTHLGVILLLVGEFVTGFAAKEGNMTIREGETVNFVEDIRSSEFAVVDQSDPADDLVTVVPARFMGTGETISHEALPFTIQVTEWMSNAQLLGPMQAPADRKGLADSGSASELAAIPIARANGVDGATVDAPAAYVTLFDGDERLGSYLFSVYLEQPQAVVVDGKTYWMTLRFERTYKPYSVYLEDFKHDLFTGTQMARNFSSDVRLVDTGRNVDREVLIYMNHPMRHAGETFYQASYLRGDAGTVLQVVQNPGWLIPYVSCSLVTLGMLLHFGIRLMPSKGRRSS
ncbi:MAG: cytochrome c biogenesis protein ResB [Phycisphaerales bacterium]|nr:cytochrome c biogenesis protein ResB [Phycisphaerales bacterium]